MLQQLNLNDQSQIKFEDSKVPFWMIKKNGYYIVGEKKYIHKTNAVIEATQKNLDIKWEFGSDVFNKINWREPINISIQELYRMRAQQLRDKYDYLILTFSGGADSSNVLDSFINNNIHLDEVLIHWPRSLTQGKYKISSDPNAFNILSEWELAVIPKLEYIKNNYPKIKITIDDLSDLSEEYSEDGITITKNKFHYLNIKRQRAICRRSSDLLNKNINVATIYGFDKPRLTNINNVITAFFVDEHTSIVSDISDGYERNIEYFYWAIDLPELPIKQAQILYQYTKSIQNKNIEKINLALGISQPTLDIEAERRTTSSLLYPTWNSNTFQANKPKYFSFNCEYHAWVHDDSHKFLESWTSAFKQYDILIADRFKETREGGYKQCRTKYYPLGMI